MHIEEKLEENKGAWTKELPEVIWGYKTGETHFALVYNNEAVIQFEVGMLSHRTQHFNVKQSMRALYESLGLPKEKRDGEETRAITNKKKTEQYFNKRVKLRSLKIRDLVVKETGVTTAEEGKLSPRSEGPYIVKTSHKPGFYGLKDALGKELTHP